MRRETGDGRTEEAVLERQVEAEAGALCSGCGWEAAVHSEEKGQRQ